MSFTQTLRQISVECNSLVSGSSPSTELKKPNQTFIKALNKETRSVQQKSRGNQHSLLLNQKCPVLSWLLRCRRKSVKKCKASNSLFLCSLETLRLFSGWLPRTILQIFPSSMVLELWRLLPWQTQITGSGVLALSSLPTYPSDLVQLWNRSILTSGSTGVFSPNPHILGRSRNVCPSCHTLLR